MIPRRGKPVVGPDGTEYKSQAAAARALGVHHSTIRDHIEKYGSLERIGLDGCRCSWRGKEYPTLQALARASGLARQTILYHLAKHGNLDRLGMGRGRTKGNGSSRAKPVRVGPYEWPSQTMLARELGVPISTLSLWLKPSTPAHHRDRIMQFAMRKSAAGAARSTEGDAR